MSRVIAGMLALWIAAGAAAAEGMAVMIAMPGDGERLTADVRQRLAAVERAFGRAGYRVERLDGLDEAALVSRLQALGDDLDAAERAVVFAYGPVAHTDWDSYLMAPGYPGRALDPLSIGGVSLSVSGLATFAARVDAPIFVARASYANSALGPGLQPGIAAPGAEWGGVVVTGRQRDLVTFLIDTALAPGTTMAEMTDGMPEAIRIYGTPEPNRMLGPGHEGRAAAEGTGGATPGREELFWTLAERNGGAQAYRDYLARYPNGAYADEARRRLGEIDPPADPAAAAEAALSLGRVERQAVQRHLTILGHRPGGIDGVFGPATRRGIERWQQAGGHDVTGYLTGDQVRELGRQSRSRQAALEKEAEERRADSDAADLAFWRDVGSRGGEANLRAYLQRYPDGLRAAEARRQLDVIMFERAEGAGTPDRELWEVARRSDSIAAYRDYLEARPDGAFAEEARQRIAAIERRAAERPRLEAARAAEDQVLGNVMLRLFLERRLASEGYELSAPDGQIDETTRRAIRRFQRDAGLPVTGYADQLTLVRILVGAAG